MVEKIEPFIKLQRKRCLLLSVGMDGSVASCPRIINALRIEYSGIIRET